MSTMLTIYGGNNADIITLFARHISHHHAIGWACPLLAGHVRYMCVCVRVRVDA
jgi:hypothetical protein